MELDNEYCLVKYKNLWLTPMKKIRAFTLKNKGKAKLYKDKFTGLLVCRLLYKPSGFKVINYSCGFDPGSMCNNITVVSNRDQYSLQHNTDRGHVSSIQGKMSIRRLRRHERRVNKRWRPQRHDNRSGHRHTATDNYYYQVRFRLIYELNRRFNFTELNIEMPSVAIASFQTILIGSRRLFKNLADLGIQIYKFRGSDTKEERIRKLGIPEFSEFGDIINYSDPKNYNKLESDWNCHSIDSFILATYGINLTPRHKRYYLITRNFTFRWDGKKVRPIHRRPYYIPRSGIHYLNGRVYHKLHRIRYRRYYTSSNHGPWNYLYSYSISPGWNHKVQWEAGYTDYQGRYYTKINGRPTCKFRNPNTLRYEYTKLTLIEG